MFNYFTLNETKYFYKHNVKDKRPKYSHETRIQTLTLKYTIILLFL